MVDETQTRRAEAIVVSLAQGRAFLGREWHLVTPAPTRAAVEARTTRRTAFLTRETIQSDHHFFSAAVQLSTTVMGEAAGSVDMLMRNRCPSRLGT